MSPDASFSMTAAAAMRICAINQENGADQGLRIAVQGGGCAGFQYTFLMDNLINPDDHVFEHGGAKVILDEMSLSLLNGSCLEFQEDLSSSMFVIKNPLAVLGCGCGNSFSI
jgi:iron-sulfur cluster assembly accessory protein